MNAKVSPDTTHRLCSRCGVLKPLTDFAVNRANGLGRQYGCRPCRAEYDRKRRPPPGPRGPKPNMGPAVVLPAMDINEQLWCVRLRKWAKCVETNPRFGVAMIGGGYV